MEESKVKFPPPNLVESRSRGKEEDEIEGWRTTRPRVKHLLGMERGCWGIELPCAEVEVVWIDGVSILVYLKRGIWAYGCGSCLDAEDEHDDDDDDAEGEEEEDSSAA